MNGSGNRSVYREKEYYKRSLKIAAPCIFENIMVMIISFVDSIMVGSLGRDATAAVGVNASPTWLLNSLSAGFAVGGTVLVARHVGAKEYNKANEVATQTICASMVFSAVVMGLMILFSRYIPLFMGAEEAVMPDAVKYMSIYSRAIMVHFTGIVASGIIRGAGNTKVPMLVSLLTNVVNVIGNFFLIYETRSISVIGRKITIWGAGWGVAGAATSTAFAQILSGVILVALLLSHTQAVRINVRQAFRFNKSILGKVFAIGLPSAGERFSLSLGQVFYQRMISELGTVQIAAHFLANTAESISYMPAAGFSVASTTLIGNSLGAKNKKDASAYASINLMLACLVGALCGAAFLVFPERLLGLFTPDPDVIAAGANALRVMAVVEPFFSLCIVYTGILRGAGDTKMPFFASLAGMWGVRLASSWFFAYHLKLGLTGAWIGMAIDISLRTLLLYLRYRKKNWLDIELT